MHSTMLLTLACLNVYFVKTESLIARAKPVFGLFFRNVVLPNFFCWDGRHPPH